MGALKGRGKAQSRVPAASSGAVEPPAGSTPSPQVSPRGGRDPCPEPPPRGLPFPAPLLPRSGPFGPGRPASQPRWESARPQAQRVRIPALPLRRGAALARALGLAEPHPPSCRGPSGRSGNVSFLPAARPPLVFSSSPPRRSPSALKKTPSLPRPFSSRLPRSSPNRSL